MNRTIHRNDLIFEVDVRWLGLIDYDQAFTLQTQIHQDLIDSHQNRIVILGLEHPSVITLGKRSKAQEDLKMDESKYFEKSILIRHIDRGGFATLHNPGQLVIYPLINLQKVNWGIKDYVSIFQGTIRDQIKEIGVDCFCSVDDPGVFSKNGKIASIGLRIHQQTTMHGASINMYNDLSEFQLLNPCGMVSRTMDRLGNYTQISTQDFFLHWVEKFILKIGYHSDTCG